MGDSTKPLSIREAIESDVEDDGYEPQPLWMIPVYLRSRLEYYDDALARIRNHTEGLMRDYGHLYSTPEGFKRLEDIAWNRHSPYWWGLADIVAWMDVRACTRSAEIQVSLFRTTKKPSRRLRDKRYVFDGRTSVPIVVGATNEFLRERTIQAVERLAASAKLRKRYIDLERWRRLVRHTDLVGIINAAAEADLISVDSQ